MSIVIDNLFDDILEKTAQNFERQNLLAEYETALKMANGLFRQLSEPSVGATGSNLPTKTDLQSIDTFIDYVAKNGFVYGYDNTKIVEPASQTKDVLKGPGYVAHGQYMVHTDGLVALLKQFDGQARESGNVYLQELLDSLITEANEKLGVSLPKDEVQPSKTDKPGAKSGDKPGISAKPEIAHLIPTGQQSAEVKALLEALPSGRSSLLPYNQTTHFLSVSNFKAFGDTVQRAGRQLPTQLDQEAVNSAWGNLNIAIEKWMSATPTNQVRSGFEYEPHSLRVDDFVHQYADGDRNKALSILSMMQTICYWVNVLINQLKVSPTVVQLLGGELQRQSEYGEAYIRAFSDAMSFIRSYNPNFGSGHR